MKKYNIQNLSVIEIKNNYNTHYLICKCNKKGNTYIEIFTNEKINVSDQTSVKPLSDYYLGQTNDGVLFLDKKQLLKIYLDINNEAMLEQSEKLEETKENKFLDVNTELEKATLNFFPKDGTWWRGCFKRPSELGMVNLPCHLRDDLWLAKMLKKDQNLYYISLDKILKFVKNSPFFEEKRHEYEQEIVRWQINFIVNHGEGWICDDEYGGDFVYMTPVCDLGVRKGVVDTLSKIGINEDAIEEGLEKNVDLWRDSFMEQAFRNEYEPVFFNLGGYVINKTYENTNNKIELPQADRDHKENWIKMRKYEYYKRHKNSVDKYGVVEPEMLMTDEEAFKLKTYLEEKHIERKEEIEQYQKVRLEMSHSKQKVKKSDYLVEK